MSSQVALYLQQAELIQATVRANLEGLSHRQSLAAPEPAGNCPNWVLGHLTETYERTLALLGRERVLEEGALTRYGRGSAPIDAREARPFEELLETWRVASDRIAETLQELSDRDLERSGDFFGTGKQTSLERVLNFIFFHQAYHAGQLGVLRRVAGEQGAIR